VNDQPAASAPCLTPEEIEVLAVRGTSGGTEEPADRHVKHCAACRAKVEEAAASNAFLTKHIEGLKAGMGDPPPGVRAGNPTPASLPKVPGLRFLSRVSEGGQGVVFKALQTATRRKVAVKMLRLGILATERQLHRFERETELLASLRHPNIVAVHDSGRTTEGHDYLVMEWINGVPLDRYVQDHFPLAPAPDAAPAPRPGDRIQPLLTLFIKIARAIEHAHGGSVIHRDLKPSNILVDDAGEPHIIDFGLARQELGGRGAAPTMTEDFVGTRAYASPEQVSGATGLLRVTTDVYSLGVMFFQMLTGAFPYPTDGRASAVDQHIQTTPPSRPRLIVPSIPADVETIVLTALAKEPERRYQTAGSLANDLDDYLAGRPISAKRDSRWYIASRWLRRNRRAAALVSAAMVLSIVAGASLISSRIATQRAKAERERALAERERSEALALVAQAMGQSIDPTEPLNFSYDAGVKGTYGERGLDRLRLSLMLGWPGNDRGVSTAATSSIATLISTSGREILGEELARQTATERKLALGLNHAGRLDDLMNLAEILLVRGQFRDAQRAADQALDLARNNPADPHVYVAPQLDLLARVALKRSEAPRALALASEALTQASSPSEAASLELAQVLATRSEALASLGRWREAQADLTQALRIRLALLPDESPAIARSLEGLASIVEQLDRETPEDPLAKAMDATTNAELAGQLRALSGDLDRLLVNDPRSAIDPVPVLRRVLRLKHALLGPEHRGLLSTIAALSIELQLPTRAGHETTAELLKQAVAILDADPGSSVIARALALERAALALLHIGQSDEAFVLWERSVALWWGLPDGVRDDLQAAANTRGLALFQLIYGEYERAEANSRHVLEVIRPIVGPDHKLIAIAMAQRALALVHLGRGEEAEREARAAHAMSQRLGQPEHDDQRILNSQCLGLVLIERGAWAEGRDLLVRTIEILFFPEKVKKSWHSKAFQALVRASRALGDAEGEVHWQAKLDAINP
jgi:eukaryotic-like serine/threonine-protein kinase